MGKIGSAFQKAIELTVALFLVILSFICFVNVILRYIFSKGLSWSEELALTCFLWIIFLGAVLAAKERLHIKVDLFLRLLPERIRRVVDVMVHVIVLFTLYMLFVGSMAFVGNAHKSYSQAIPWLRYSYVYGAIIPGVIGMFVVFAGDLIRSLRGR